MPRDDKNSKSNHVRTSLIIAAVVVGSMLLYQRNNPSESTDQEVASTNKTTSEVTEETSSEDPVETEEEAEQNEATVVQQPEEKPVSSTLITVDDPPVLYTGFGHSQSNPLPTEQRTSSTCTTEPNIDCIITFTNVDTNQIISHTVTSSDQGVAVFSWIGGNDIPSGTWHIQAAAGDKTSETETIYVQ